MPVAAPSRVIPANEYRRERWRNGLGWTREIHAAARPAAARPAAARPAAGNQAAVDPIAGDAWAWRLSIAEIERDAPFSSFPGVDRELVLLSGNGLRLRFDDGESMLLEPPHGRMRFAGERAVTGELVDAQLWHRPLVGPMVIFAEPGATWAVHLLAGQARFADDSGLPGLEAGDTALLVAGEQRLRHVLDGGGEVLLVRLQPLPA